MYLFYVFLKFFHAGKIRTQDAQPNENQTALTSATNADSN